MQQRNGREMKQKEKKKKKKRKEKILPGVGDTIVQLTFRRKRPKRFDKTVNEILINQKTREFLIV